MEIADDARMDCSDERLELVKEMYTACDATHAEDYADYFRDDARFVWQNFEPVEGRDGITAFVGNFFDDIETLDHSFTGVYEADVADETTGDEDATVVLESVVTYTLLDGDEIDVPATTTLDVDESDAVVEARVYVDTAPLYE
ncbi:MAG: nuclear transport factor 2 family protein [Halobacteriales archaeon]|nr:nuclear transport factor 2 family protein [Halobacteriales archaeon]